MGTPLNILQIIAADWGRIALDPAGDPERMFAEVTAILDPEEIAEGVSCLDGSPVRQQHADGLAIPWVDRTFVNPPYKLLEPWLEKFRATGTGARVIMLIPVRPHRKWWRSVVGEAHDVFYMDPIKFVGWTNAFPGPLCLISNDELPEGLDVFGSRLQ